MLVFWQKKLVIFSVPKTGTSALDEILAPHADIAITAPPILKHMPVYRYNRFIRPLFDVVDGKDLEGFAMVREPFDWLGSWYRYRSRPELDGMPNSTKYVTFDEFVIDAMKGRPPPHANVGSQARFLSGGTGPNGVRHLFQYEQIGLACDFLEDRLGIKIDLTRVNESKPQTLELGQNARDRYERKRHLEFDIWKGAAR